MSKLLEYFNVVDKNAVVRAAHQAAPLASMEAFGLTADEQSAIMSGDKMNLAKAAGLATIDFPAMHTPNTVYMPAGRMQAGKLQAMHTPLTYFLN